MVESRLVPMMLILSLTALLSVPALAQPALAQEEAKPRIEPIALRIARAVDGAGFDTPPLGGEQGTRLRLLLTEPRRAIVRVDERRSQIETFTDDTGRDLLAGGRQQNDGGFGNMQHRTTVAPFSSISQDGARAVVSVRSPGVPAPDSRLLRLAGTLAVEMASGTRSETIENVALEAGPLEAGEAEIAIEQVQQPEMGQHPMTVTLTLEGEAASTFAGAALRGTEGEELTDRRLSRMVMMDTVRVQYGLIEPAEEATITLNFHEDLETVEVPVELETGLGLAP